jgi:hypothetical protein
MFYYIVVVSSSTSIDIGSLNMATTGQFASVLCHIASSNCFLARAERDIGKGYLTRKYT